jgi:hypothetical protein
MYREVTMIEVREVLRLRGEGLPKKRSKNRAAVSHGAASASIRVSATISDEEVRQACIPLVGERVVTATVSSTGRIER